MADDLFVQLLEYQWKGVAFPATSFRVHLSQDLAEHKFVEKDGADFEPTGRNPLEFTARIPFLNGAIPGSNESWPKGRLYPTQFRQFLSACADRSKGTLQHPELGPVTCVLRHCEVDWNAGTRDGVYVDAAWVETFDAANNLDAILSKLSPVSVALSAAQQVDSAIPSLNLPQLPQYQPGLTDLVRSVQGVFDTASLLSAKIAGAINQIGYRANAILDAIDRVSTSNDMAVESVKNGQTRMALDRLRVAAIDMKETLLTSGKTVAIYIPSGDTTIPMLCAPQPTGPDLGKVKDLIALNTSLALSAVVPAQSSVRYYKS